MEASVEHQAISSALKSIQIAHQLYKTGIYTYTASRLMLVALIQHLRPDSTKQRDGKC